MKLHIKAVTGNKFTIEAEPSLSVEEFKALVSAASEIPVEQQRLIFKGHILKDAQTLESYGMSDESTLHLVRAPGQQSASTPTQTTPTATTTPTASAQPSPTPAAPVTPTNPFGGGLGGFGGAMPPNVAQMASNPDFMNTMMSNPMVQSMLDNPETLRAIINSNPQMRELMERNPEIRHALDNPQLLRQSMEAMRNPDMMREMMRNTDRAISNIEAHPEGFNALRRMYQDVQEPLMEATSAANPFMSMFQPPANTPSETSTSEDTQNTPLSNPWAPQPQQQTPRQQQSLGGLGGMDLGAFGGMEGMAGMGGMGGMGGIGGMPAMDPQMLGQMMQDPMVQNMMTTMLSNPQFMQQAIDSNPMLRQMIQNNPGMRETLSNPEFLRRLSDPNTIQAMLQMQGAMQQMQRLNEAGGTAAVNPFGTTQITSPPTNPSTAAQPPRPFDLSAMMNSMGMGGAGQAGLFGAPQPQVPPAQLYATQLEQLQAMGFYDEQQNITALQATGGNVSAAVERLLQQ